MEALPLLLKSDVFDLIVAVWKGTMHAVAFPHVKIVFYLALANI